MSVPIGEVDKILTEIIDRESIQRVRFFQRRTNSLTSPLQPWLPFTVPQSIIRQGDR